MNDRVIYAVDPGRKTGVARYLPNDDGSWRLFDCDLVKDSHLPWLMKGGFAIIERPEVYDPRFSKGDPNDLITLAIQAGRYEQQFLDRGVRVAMELPKAWKGQVTKDAHERQTRRALGAGASWADSVMDTKKIPASYRNNVWDAIALGLWASKRVGILWP